MAEIIVARENWEVDARIPEEYRKFWRPYKTDGMLYHITPRINLDNIRTNQGLEPRDPAPRNWAGMKAVFLADPTDPLYKDAFFNVLAHAKKKHEDVVRLHIKTGQQLYRSLDPERTFQVISLDHITPDCILEIEELKK